MCIPTTPPVDRPDDAAARFLSLASHDLRGPLSTVRSYASLLRSPRFVLDDRVRAAVEVILRNVDRALGQWELLAEAWRLDIGGLGLDLRDEDLLPLIRASADAAATTAREHGIRLDVLLPASLPLARVDLDRVVLVLAGAWAHLLERTRPGGAAGLGARAEATDVALTFWDSGPPLNPEAERHVFDRQWQTLRGHELGTAFRMALAGALVQAHGGRAEVGSLNGRTLFHFRLPGLR